MARFAIIEGGVVANIVEADSAFAQSQGWIDATGGCMGDLWNGVSFSSAAANLDAEKDAQKAVVSQSCQDAILAGFTSSALGSAHSYPAKFTDQQNLNASVTASLLPGVDANWTTPFWCADAEGNWSYAAHTAAQIQQAGSDGKAAILTCLTKNQQLAAQIDAATTIPAVQAITWS
jgi:hypothetical protein